MRFVWTFSIVVAVCMMTNLFSCHGQSMTSSGVSRVPVGQRKKAALVPFPRVGRSSLVAFPRVGRSSLVAFPRVGRPNNLVAFPRVGKADFLIPASLSFARYLPPKVKDGKRSSLVAFPRVGRNDGDDYLQEEEYDESQLESDAVNKVHHFNVNKM